MSQQLVNGSYRDGAVTYTVRLSSRYAVIGTPYAGKWRKPQTPAAIKRRKEWWAMRNKQK